MKIITWMVRIIVLLILVWLALQNNQTVVFSLMDGLQLSIPLIVLLLVFFAFGVILGLLILLPKYWGLKWDARKLRKENEQNKLVLARQEKLLGNTTKQQTQTVESMTDLPPFTM
ncbi:MAG: DUF1049 domain-containing protein [Hydromonas sp.]|jgi:putative membrane protein|nr:DUF1049 domain-containing protein [Hydromonas sp.]